MTTEGYQCAGLQVIFHLRVFLFIYDHLKLLVLDNQRQFAIIFAWYLVLLTSLKIFNGAEKEFQIEWRQFMRSVSTRY